MMRMIVTIMVMIAIDDDEDDDSNDMMVVAVMMMHEMARNHQLTALHIYCCKNGHERLCAGDRNLVCNATRTWPMPWPRWDRGRPPQATTQNVPISGANTNTSFSYPFYGGPADYEPTLNG